MTRTSQASDGSLVVDGSVISSTIVIAADRHHEARGPLPSEEDQQQATRIYLQYLHDRYRYLDLKGMGVADRVALKLPLMDLFVPLKARIELPEGETWHRGAKLAGREVPEEEVVKLGLRQSEPKPVGDLVREHEGLIVLGDPGSGKTTFLKSLAVALAEGRIDEIGLGPRMPILVPLSAYANRLEKEDVRLDDFIGEYVHNLGCDAAVLAMLKEDLKAGRALLLLDGLDEVRSLSLRQTVVRRVVDFFTFHRRAGNKFVMTSRIVGYREVRTLAEGLTECTLVDLDDEEVRVFVKKWTSALERQAQGETRVAEADAERERRDLLTAIEGNPGVRRLAANPLLLTILALMKRQGVSLPERRVELYDLYMKTLLSSWNRARGLDRPPQRDLDVVETVRVLAPLALWMHEVDPGLGLVKREELHRQLLEIFGERGDEDPEQRSRLFLADVREYAGLLLERGPAEYGFIHLTFEEYLAAVAIALDAQGNSAKIVAKVVEHLSDAAWREVSLLLVGYVGLIQQLDAVASSVVEDLVEERPGPPGEAVVLAGAAVLDVGTSGVLPRVRRSVIDALVSTMQDASVLTPLRRQAGLYLGRLGWRPGDMDVFFEVPPGSFLYGEEKELREIKQRFWIAKYPVTNFQFAKFVDDDGYSCREFWSEVGWQWKKNGNRTGPAESDSDWANPIFPRAGVSWYEAEAYCRWLTATATSFEIQGELRLPEKIQFQARLPSQIEWERASRGTQGHIFPWGDKFHADRVNTSGNGIGGKTAVCTYPSGVSSIGAWDMAGNIHEWTMSKTAAARTYVVCGGCCYWPSSAARCSARASYDPGFFHAIVGFRVILSLANSDC